MELSPLQRMSSWTPLARPLEVKQAKVEQAAPVEPSDSSDLQASVHSPVSGPPRSSLMAMGLIGALGTMAQLFLGAAPAAAQVPPPQVQVQVQAAPSNPVADLTTQIIVHGRHGQVLGQDRMLKMDPYPGLHTTSLQKGDHPQPLIEGAPNFRQVEGSSVYGTAQPTVDGLKSVLSRLGAGPQSKGPKVTWTTLREEPVVYIQGKSFTIREVRHPFTNLEAPGVSGATVEAQEEQLKHEILEEAQRYGGKFLTHEEQADGSVVARWVNLKASDVQTPQEVFQSLQKQGYNVDYARIPVTDEKAPENQDFDALVERLRQADPKSPLVFNCHAGRGRTTTGMVIGQLFRNAQFLVGDPSGVSGSQYEQGNFKAILQLLESLRDGSSSKGALDAVIDKSGEVQNLRTAIARLKEKSETTRQPGQAEESLSRGKDYLYRYYKLIAFESYLREMSPQGYPENFSSWIARHPELDITPNQLELVYNHFQSGGTQLA